MKVAIITGASSGIGEATVLALAKAGYAISMVARNIEKLEEMKAGLASSGYNVIALKTDVTKREEVKSAVTQTMDAFGSVDVLVNNAGIMPLSFLKFLHEDEWEQMVDVNIKGVLNGIGAVLPIMMNQKSGHIVNISSVAGVKYFPSGTVYCATKFALEAITEGIRYELSREFNIKATSIQPGAVATNLTSTITDNTVFEMWDKDSNELIPLESEDIANAVVFALEQPDRVNINAMLIRPTTQDE